MYLCPCLHVTISLQVLTEHRNSKEAEGAMASGLPKDASGSSVLMESLEMESTTWSKNE